MPGFFYILYEQYPCFVHIHHKEISIEKRIFATGVLNKRKITSTDSDNFVVDIQMGQSGEGNEFNSHFEYRGEQFCHSSKAKLW